MAAARQGACRLKFAISCVRGIENLAESERQLVVVSLDLIIQKCTKMDQLSPESDDALAHLQKGM